MYSCTVVRPISPMFDGYNSLTGIDAGDVVHVLEENVGPDEKYHLCRKGENIGWFPIQLLQKVDNEH